MLDKMMEHHQPENEMIPLSIQSTARTFLATEDFRRHMGWFFSEGERAKPIGNALLPDYFTYRTDLREDVDGSRQLEQNLIGAMPWIVSSAESMLTAAQANTQAESDRAFRSVSQEPAYRDKNLLYVSGMHVDISPYQGEQFILTKFIP